MLLEAVVVICFTGFVLPSVTSIQTGIQLVSVSNTNECVWLLNSGQKPGVSFWIPGGNDLLIASLLTVVPFVSELPDSAANHAVSTHLCATSEMVNSRTREKTNLQSNKKDE
ncbi:hypothetical protein GQ42DRAFT_161204 [Ramicandelaber brevisporus]|nr:hypothetical protein GQ42DRAFT_161204 [Ramicandelaber brevisporus]